MFKEKVSHRTHIFLIIFFGVMVYANSLSGKFVWDDRSLVRDNTYIRDFKNAGRFFLGSVSSENSFKEYRNYRPFQMLAYNLGYSIWKLDVRGYHLTSIIFHILTGVSVYWLVNIIFGDVLLALLTAVLFTIHPVNTEAVSYISGLSDPLSAFFLISAFILYVKAVNIKETKVFSVCLLVISYLSALLSREASIIFPLFLVLYHFSFKIRIKKSLFYLILAVSILFILFRHLIMPVRHFSLPFSQRVFGFFSAFVTYLKIIVVPINLHMEYPVRVFNIHDIKVILGALSIVSLASLAAAKIKSNKIISFSILWFLICLIPYSNIYSMDDHYLREHWLYLPAIGLYLLIAYIVTSFYKRKKTYLTAMLSIIALVSYFSYFTIRQNEYWKEPIGFFKRTIIYAPFNYKLYINLGNAYCDEGNLEEAFNSYEQSLKVYPGSPDAYNNMGNIYLHKGEYQKAISLYEKALNIDPRNIMASYNLELARKLMQ